MMFIVVRSDGEKIAINARKVARVLPEGTHYSRGRELKSSHGSLIEYDGEYIDCDESFDAVIRKINKALA